MTHVIWIDLRRMGDTDPKIGSIGEMQTDAKLDFYHFAISVGGQNQLFSQMHYITIDSILV